MTYISASELDKALQHLYLLFESTSSLPNPIAKVNVEPASLIVFDGELINAGGGVSIFDIANGSELTCVYLTFGSDNTSLDGSNGLQNLKVDLLDLAEITTFIENQLPRFDDVHKYLRYLLLRTKGKVNLYIGGYGYGGGIAQISGVLFEYIHAFQNSLYSSGKVITDIGTYLYSDYLSRSVINEIRATASIQSDASPSSQFASIIYYQLIDEKADLSNNRVIINHIIQLDQRLFSRLSLVNIYMFGSPPVLSGQIISEYDNIVGSNGSLTLQDRTYQFAFRSDPIFKILDTNTATGVYYTSRFKPRSFAGKIILIEPSEWWRPQHLLARDYIPALQTRPTLPIYNRYTYELPFIDISTIVQYDLLVTMPPPESIPTWLAQMHYIVLYLMYTSVIAIPVFCASIFIITVTLLFIQA